jgi:hypothetical protein
MRGNLNWILVEGPRLSKEVVYGYMGNLDVEECLCRKGSESCDSECVTSLVTFRDTSYYLKCKNSVPEELIEDTPDGFQIQNQRNPPYLVHSPCSWLPIFASSVTASW